MKRWIFSGKQLENGKYKLFENENIQRKPQFENSYTKYTPDTSTAVGVTRATLLKSL